MKETGKVNIRGRTAQVHRQVFRRMLLIQLSFILLIVAVLMVAQGWVSAYSALLGGLIYLLPSGYQTHQALAPTHANNIRQVLWNLYKSEIWKMALTLMLFGVVFVSVRPIEPFSLFSAFVLMQVIAWFVPLLMKRRARRTAVTR